MTTMKRSFLFLAILLASLTSFAQALGISFFQGSWDEALLKARQERKLVFIDFFTEWCGPCYNMAHQVFVLPSVGDFYNNHFVNLKIDAEKGEGRTLAATYGVRVFPTYIFVDPSTAEAVHRSSSRQDAGQFVFTGYSATQPSLRSFYLEKEYADGNRGRKLLINYINYENSIYQHEQVGKAFDELMATGAKLTDKDVWEVYCEAITGMDNPYLKQVSDNYGEFCKLFGKSAVDDKLRKETRYGDVGKIMSLCDFGGKSLNVSLIEAEGCIRAKEYRRATAMIDSLIASPSVDQQALIGSLKFMVRLSYRHGDFPDFWIDKCVDYLRYIAYNYADRNDASIHQEYAAALELVLERYGKGKQVLGELMRKPVVGKNVYDMRPAGLKPKPMRKK